MRADESHVRLRRRLAALIAVVAMADFAFGAVNIVHMTNAGLAPSSIGAVLAIAGIVSTIVEAPSGALGDMYGQRRILVIGLFLWGSGQMLFGLTSSPWPIGVALVLWAVGMACYSGAPFALVINELRAEGHEDFVGWTVRQVQVVRWCASAVGVVGGVTKTLADAFFGALWFAIGVTEATAVVGAALLALTAFVGVGLSRPWRLLRVPDDSSFGSADASEFGADDPNAGPRNKSGVTDCPYVMCWTGTRVTGAGRVLVN